MTLLLGKKLISRVGRNKLGLICVPLSQFSTQNAAAKDHFRVRDQLIRAHTHNLQIALIHNTRTTKVAKEKHTLDNKGTKLLGECMSGVSLMASLLEGEERVGVEANNVDGYERVYAEAIQLGEVRGLALKSDTSLPITKSILSVRKILYNQAKPVTGIVDLQNGDITSLFAQYFHISEQIPTCIKLETVIQEESENVKFSGGVLIQTMPNAPSGLIEQVRKRVESHSLSELFVDSKMSLSDIIPLLIPKEELALKHTQNNDTSKENSNSRNNNDNNNNEQLETTRTLIDFHCRCNKNGFREKLLTIGASELESLRKDNQRDLHCYFCSKKYVLTDQDFDWLFEKIREKEKS